MTSEPLPDAVQSFVLKYVDSVAQLEGLLLLRSHAESGWDVSELASRLYIGEAEAGQVLQALHRRVLLSREGERYRYDPKPMSLRAEVDALAHAYPAS